jgi:peroxiredoxin (alkyl hydroperoxide reductase subunit C)
MENKSEQVVISMPRIGDAAPGFKALTSRGIINFPGDYEGKWTILFSQPTYHSPMSTTEYISFDRMEKEFENVNCELIELSTEGLNSHIAWLRSIQEEIEYESMKDIKISFPSVEDFSEEVAQKYGMIQINNTSNKFWTVFFINPKGIINAIIQYPQNTERNFESLYKIELATQIAQDYHSVTTTNGQQRDYKAIRSSDIRISKKGKVEYSSEDCEYWFH